MKNYYRLISQVDAACREIVQDLDRQKLLQDTMVIFTTDNGYFHGEHGLAEILTIRTDLVPSSYSS